MNKDYEITDDYVADFDEDDVTDFSESQIFEKNNKKKKTNNNNRDHTIPVWLMMNSATQ